MSALLLVLGYFIGSIPFGLLIGRACGVDVRSAGSGNIGATNVWRTCGKKAGLLAFGLDVAKGYAPTVLAMHLAPGQTWLHLLAGVAALCGHAFSPFLGFKGGKAVSTCLGVILALDPVAGLGGFALWGVLVKLTGYVSVGSLFGSAMAGVLTIVRHDPPAYQTAMWLAVALIWVRHRGNIQRLLAGTELRTDGSSRQEPKSS